MRIRLKILFHQIINIMNSHLFIIILQRLNKHHNLISHKFSMKVFHKLYFKNRYSLIMYRFL